MTPTYNSGIANPISRITLGGLQDLGYAVDYSKAQAYTGYNSLAACPCARRLGDDTTVARQLDEAEQASYDAVFEFGKNLLTSAQNDLSAAEVGDGFQSVIGEWVSVAYTDDTGGFRSLIVRKEDLAS
jgi:hypothetical protein